MEDILSSLGLSPSESKIYLALLKYGELRTSEILDRSGLNSGRIYDILSSLERKGLISMVEKEGVKHYSAAPPSILRDMIEERRRKIDEQDSVLLSRIPEFMKLYSSHQDALSVSVYAGKKGAKTAYEMLFQNAKRGDNLLVIGTTRQKNVAKWLSLFLKTYVYPTRKKLKLKIRKLMDTEAKKDNLWALDGSKIRYLPWNVLSSYEICGDVVVLQIFHGDSLYVVIRNKQTADDFREQFELLWKMAKP